MKILEYNPTRAFTATAEGNVAAGQAVGQGTTWGQVKPANPTGGAIQPVGLAAAATSDGETVLVLPECTVYDTALFLGFAAGARLYVGAGGAIANAALIAANDIVPLVGFMVRTDCAQLNINPVATKIVAAANSNCAFA